MNKLVSITMGLLVTAAFSTAQLINMDKTAMETASWNTLARNGWNNMNLWFIRPNRALQFVNTPAITTSPGPRIALASSPLALESVLTYRVPEDRFIGYVSDNNGLRQASSNPFEASFDNLAVLTVPEVIAKAALMNALKAAEFGSTRPADTLPVGSAAETAAAKTVAATAL